MPLHLLSALFSVLLLTACGGGGGSGGNSGSPADGGGGNGGGDGGGSGANPSQGVFLDSAVSGLNYQTRDSDGATLTGVTGPNGEYPVYPGRNIYFAVGKLPLGLITARSQTTPFSFMDADSSEALPVNIARFLQTLDSDGNPDNGIAIEASARSAFTNTTKTFPDDYFDQRNFSTVAEGDIRFVLNNQEIVLVDAETARSHLNQTLATIDEQISLPGTRWRTDYMPINLSYFDEAEGWVTRQTCTDQDYGLYRIDEYGASRVTSTYWESFSWLPRCERTGQEVVEQSRDYDENTLCGHKLASDSNANLTLCTFADLNSVETYESGNVTVTVYSAYAPDSGVVYRTVYKEYYEQNQDTTIQFREKWQLVSTQLFED
ncbi:MAG: hypothetical protein R3208_08285 [Ketobacteraceae bacterium]|nr:hypothetical protein [Ketobacteraceae bacterium]